MKRIAVQVPDEMYDRLKKEMKEGKWSSMADAVRYYARRGMES